MVEPRQEEHAVGQLPVYRGRRGKAVIGVLTVLREEFEEVKAMLDIGENLPDSPYFVHQLKVTNSYNVVLRNLGDRGNDTSATRTSALLEDFRPHYVLLVGIAGGVKGRDDTEIGDVVVPDFIDGYEMRKYSGRKRETDGKLVKLVKAIIGHEKLAGRKDDAGGEGKKRAKARDHPGYRLVRNIAEPIAISNDWIQRVDRGRRPNESEQQPKVILGPLIFGEKILGDHENEYQRAVLEEFDNAVAVDMETGGVGLALYEARITKHYNPLYLVVRAISDFTNEPLNNETRQVWKPYVAHVAAAFAAEVIQKLIEQE